MNALAGIKNFRYSRTLFTKEDDATPLSFYCAVQNDDLEEIIKKGGGILRETKSDETINLCDQTQKELIQKGFLPLSYIKKCILRSVLLDPEKYRRQVIGNQNTHSPQDGNDDDGAEDHFNSVTSSCLVQVPATCKGRSKYTDQEDFKIIEFIVKRRAFKKTSGNALWKRMASCGVTNHTSQSMRSRFHKIILPNIDLYDIPPNWKSKLSGNFKRDLEEDMSDEEVSLDETNSVFSGDGNLMSSHPLVKGVKRATLVKYFHPKDCLEIRKGPLKSLSSVQSPVKSDEERIPVKQTSLKEKKINNNISESQGFEFEEDDENESDVEAEKCSSEHEARSYHELSMEMDKNCHEEKNLNDYERHKRHGKTRKRRQSPEKMDGSNGMELSDDEKNEGADVLDMPSTSRGHPSKGNCEECVGKELTRRRVKAVMASNNFTVDEAVDFMIENQHNLWPIIE